MKINLTRELSEALKSIKHVLKKAVQPRPLMVVGKNNSAEYLQMVDNLDPGNLLSPLR